MRTTLLRAALCATLLTALATTSRAAAPPYPDVDRLIRGLGSDDFDVREDCTQALIDLGELVHPAVEKASRSDDAETRRRANKILEALNARFLLRRLKGHRVGVTCVAISHDGKRVVAGGADLSLRLWDLATGKPIHNIPRKFHTQHNEPTYTVAFSPDDKYLSGCGEWDVLTWEADRYELIFSNTASTCSAKCLSYSPDGNLLAMGCQDGRIIFWNAPLGGAKYTIAAHNKQAVDAVAFCRDGKHALSGSPDKTLELWEIAKGKKVRTFTGHTAGVRTIAVSRDGKLVASGAEDNTVRIWDLSTGKELHCLKGHTGSVRGIAFTPDGKRLLSGSNDATVALWDVKMGRRLRRMTGHGDAVCGVAITSDGKQAVSASMDRTLIVWRLPD